MEMPGEASQYSHGRDNTGVFTTYPFPSEDAWRGITILTWYMDKLSVEQAQAQVYGFIEPQSIQKSGNTQVHIQQYMQTWMSESGRDIYMAPYIDGSHWQLMVIIPKEYTVV
uniref:Ubiquitin-like protease family profile domain-containing protein n=1 Tax=Cajanus cajan TaxID=3821 RepID=A0A151T1S1_CAJCA|nr:hypothetical protein KK1_023371 [Cajanus cajan]